MAIREVTRYCGVCDGCGRWWNEGVEPLGVTEGHAANIAGEWSTGLSPGMLCGDCQRLRARLDAVEGQR